MKIKTSELKDAALDWAVAYALNGSAAFFDVFGARMLGRSITAEVLAGAIKPSTDWGQAGPLIDKFDVAVFRVADGECGAEIGHCYLQNEGLNIDQIGESRLIAACRAIVAAKLGDTVDVPEELV
tara:strand:+ start:2461 stop:2835 length:375 start_codon:yes stop_codon:yes gene_type:complete